MTPSGLDVKALAVDRETTDRAWARFDSQAAAGYGPRRVSWRWGK